MGWDGRSMFRLCCVVGLLLVVRFRGVVAGQGTWTTLPIHGERPGGRYATSVALSSDNNKMVVFGGKGVNDAPRHDLWEYDFDTATFQERGDDAPDAQFFASAASDGESLYLFGGKRGVASGHEGLGLHYTSDLWMFHQGLWTRLSGGDVHPTGREGSCMVFIRDDTLLVFGGQHVGEEKLSDTWQFDISSQTWRQLGLGGPQPDPRAGHSCAALKGHLVVWGGKTTGPTRGGDVDDCWAFDTETEEWNQVNQGEDRPSARYAHGAAAVGDDTMFLYGGLLKHRSDELWKFSFMNATDGTWERIERQATWPPAMSHTSLVSTPSELFFFGGMNEHQDYTNDFWRFDLSARSWTNLTTACGPVDDDGDCTHTPLTPTLRYGHVTAMAGSRVYVAGGMNGLGYREDVWSWASASWERVWSSQYKPTERFDHRAVVVGNDMYIFGGVALRSTYSLVVNDLWKLDMDRGVWTQLERYDLYPMKPAVRPENRQSHGFINVKDKMYVVYGNVLYEDFTGQCPPQPDCPPNKKDVWQYDLENNQWLQLSPQGDLPQGRSKHTATTVQGNIFMYGGISYVQGYYNEMLDELWELRVDSCAWNRRRTLQPRPHARMDHASTSWADVLFVLGGCKQYIERDFWKCQKEDLLNDLWAYSLSRETWTLVPIITASLPEPRHDHSLVTRGNSLILYGGRSYDTDGNSVHFDDAWELDVTPSLCLYITSRAVCQSVWPAESWEDLLRDIQCPNHKSSLSNFNIALLVFNALLLVALILVIAFLIRPAWMRRMRDSSWLSTRRNSGDDIEMTGIESRDDVRLVSGGKTRSA